MLIPKIIFTKIPTANKKCFTKWKKMWSVNCRAPLMRCSRPVLKVQSQQTLNNDVILSTGIAMSLLNSFISYYIRFLLFKKLLYKICILHLCYATLFGYLYKLVGQSSLVLFLRIWILTGNGRFKQGFTVRYL